MNNPYLIVGLLEAFEWFDESLQLSLRDLGWPQLTRPESMVMMHVQMDIVRPTDIARSLRLTRQAVHHTIASLVDRGVFELVDDPDDGRIRIVQLTAMGTAMRGDAQKIVDRLTSILTTRIGKANMAKLRAALDQEWGAPVVAGVGTGPSRTFAALLLKSAPKRSRAPNRSSSQRDAPTKRAQKNVK
ncbi:MarR family winged helix-turn-helix transcriptional regulator [Hyphomonas johnsonii]|uniref:MarR family transcriptional regulator n=1 Tax=Hyphomonas johnsonii MHS-2 TaxID=1280950 RepID=A0A059FE77_9PROT|nr:MarR family winged helix-turn-helix transcriptional regulator [Hyphomonas johnsonii]KCZ88851.1 MarR family transcriptional regulator [Hyphomonas johnsonii MHS-2]